MSKLAQRRPGFGAAATLWDLQADPRLGEAISTYCTQVVPVLELKWPMLRPDAHTFAFERADAILDFAQKNDLTMRGHALAWYHDIPDWTKQIKDSKGVERAYVDHISTVVSYYKDKLTSWDVVNEPIPDNPKSVTDRRDTFWTQHLGNRWIPLAFRTAAAADPFVKLAINEYDIESAKDSFIAKRAAYRNLIMDLLDQGVPLHAVGLQSHLHAELEIDTHGLAEFVTELRAWGLEVLRHRARCRRPEADGKSGGARCHRRQARRRPPDRDLDQRAGALDPDLGHLGPLQLDQRHLRPQGQAAEPSSAARRRVQAEAVHGRDQQVHEGRVKV